MKFSTKTRYGLRAMLEIASDKSAMGVLQKDISEKQDISLIYLDHIISELKTAGLITNVKGKRSGYVITKPAEQITVFDVHNAFEPGICVIDCMAKNVNCQREDNCVAKGFWGELNNIIYDYFKSVTLKELIDKNEVLTKENNSNQ